MQVSGGADPSSALLGSMSVLTKIASITDHPYEALASLQVKALKSHMLWQSSVGDLDALGRDTPSRLRKDVKYKVLSTVSSHMANSNKIFSEIEAWLGDHQDLMQRANQESDPELAVLLVDVVGKLKGRAPCERDTIWEDCVAHKSAELGNLLTDVKCSVESTTKVYYKGGASDWKASLAPDANLKAVLARAAATLLGVPMDSVKSVIATADKAFFSLVV